ncbi:MAG: mechanosensitive ion channel [Bryobacterales bacterium]|nr:mechanosensitive ion channel [Bryobacterales bacterium]
MRRLFGPLYLPGVLLALGTCAFCHLARGQDLNLVQIARARDTAVRNRSLSEAEKLEILTMYDRAAEAVNTALQHRAGQIAQERRKAAIEREMGSIEGEILQLSEGQAVDLADPAETTVAVEEALGRAFADRNSQVRALNELTQASGNLAKRRDEMNQRRSKIRQEEDTADDELALLQVQFGGEAWGAAFRAQAMARKQSLQAERDLLNAESQALDALRSLIPRQRDAAKLRLEAAEHLIEQLKVRSRAAQVREAARELTRVTQIAAQASALSPILSAVARQVTDLSSRLWKDDGVLLSKQEVAGQTERLKRETLRADGVAASMKRRYEAAGWFAPAEEWLHGLPMDLPKLADVERDRASKLALLDRLRQQTFTLEDRRQSELSLESQIEEIRKEWAKEARPRQEHEEAEARRLLQLRRDLTEDLLKGSQELDAQLSEFNQVSITLLQKLREIRDYAERRILFSRSTGGAISFKHAGQALAWLAVSPEWGTVWRSSWAGVAVMMGVVIALLWRGLPDRLFALLSAIVVPAAMLNVSWLLREQQGVLSAALRAGLTASAVLIAVLASVRVLLRTKRTGLPIWARQAAPDIAWLAVVIPLLWFFVGAFAAVGGLLSQSPDLASYNNSLGRLCFVLACAGGAISALRRFGPPVRAIALTMAMIPMVLALAGSYATALLLVRNTFWTLLASAAIALLYNLARRGIDNSSRNGEPAQRRIENGSQILELARFGCSLLWIAAALAIWSAALPALSMLDKVRLTASATNPLTLLAVGEAILAIGATVLLVKNLPGLLDFVFLRRFDLHTGTVYAATTIVRYLLMVLGAAAASRILGVNWGQVQWLAAALSFGIGFGLQDVFANLASGLILLFDRSIRVGDAITVGEWSGRVSRIQMRATTVTLWNRSEMVVPNREFIGSKLINWTLSKPETRVELRVGVPYGSDLDLVRRVLREVVAANPNVLPEPPAEVLLTSFGENAIFFELQAFCLYEFGRQLVLDQLHTAIYQEFEKSGVRVAGPRVNVQFNKP